MSFCLSAFSKCIFSDYSPVMTVLIGAMLHAEGCILNVESQEMKFHEWGMDVDPDESFWVESVKFNVSFLVVIRVFFEFGLSACEEIGQCS